ncbi:MAG: hypothetical protein LQ350_002249 [Teloschistes chrysophthalmus]|nr:MAG: hypothetical protein LQ350_002249 [Niorma chrysophthalma]
MAPRKRLPVWTKWCKNEIAKGAFKMPEDKNIAIKRYLELGIAEFEGESPSTLPLYQRNRRLNNEAEADDNKEAKEAKEAPEKVARRAKKVKPPLRSSISPPGPLTSFVTPPQYPLPAAPPQRRLPAANPTAQQQFFPPLSF